VNPLDFRVWPLLESKFGRSEHTTFGFETYMPVFVTTTNNGFYPVFADGGVKA